MFGLAWLFSRSSNIFKFFCFFFNSNAKNKRKKN